ncbi:MAG: 1-acyl-sn-glycerol-3-phosphate acyltransferase [Fimbriimonadales bacterium]|nr:1-acyl-sn-glycerol-3-phosphate acyltransferase [Fimbriimonadales bacterium]
MPAAARADERAAQKATLFYKFARWAVKVFFFRLLGGFRVLHSDRVPMRGPVIFCANHTSFADPPAVGCASPRPCTFFAQAGLFVPIFGQIIRALGAFPVRRGESDVGAFRTALTFLAEGRALVMFPEGTRGDGVSLRPAQKGVVGLAQKSRAHVVPVGICGAHKRLPKGAKIPRFSKITVVFGEPLTFEGYASSVGADRAKETFGEEIMRRIAALLAECGPPVKTSGETESR